MGDDIDSDDLVEETETKEPATVKKEDGKKERKLYKGEIMTAAAVSDLISKHGVLPIQPVVRKFKLHNFEHSLPPSFVATKFTPSFGGGLQMHFYQPSSGQKAYREVPKNLELNVLSGTRATELKAEWDKALETRFGYLCRRLVCTIGTDPEVFAVDKKGVVIPAWEYLPDKKTPTKFSTNPGGIGFTGQAYWDGFQAEFNTQPGLSCLAQMGDVIQAGLKTIYQSAQKKKGTLTLDSVVQVTDEALQTAKPEHVAFGCAPSRNIYGLKGNDRDGREVQYRFAGGHIHIGYAPGDTAKLERIVRMLDNVLGVAAVSMFAKFDNPIRRQFYGQPGEYRLPAHGLEYRVLSNAWLAHPAIFHMTFDLARAAAGLVDEGMEHVWKATEKETVETIMNHDVDTARAILKRNESVFKGILQTIGGVYLAYSDAPEVAYKVWANGMESAIKDPRDIVKNWKLEGSWVGHSEGEAAQFARAYTILQRGAKL